MKLIQTFRLALRTLIRNPLRSFFMMLGVTIGIASLTAMASIGEATRQETLRQFKRMVGTYDVINIVPGAASTRGMPSLTTVEPVLKFSDAAAIADEADGVLQVAEVQNAFDIDIKYRDKTTVSAVYGISANWLEMRSYFIETGDIITQEDIASVARVAVIGQDIVTGLFPNEDPIGKQVRIGNVPFEVKGILVSRGAGPGGSSLDGVLFIPVTTASRRLFNRDYLTTITAQLADPDRPGPAIESIKTITVLTGVAIIAMIIGGTVIMSLMLIAVSERRREIGVRRAVGATRSDVMLQFLIEAAVVSVIGGIVGIAVGVGGAMLASIQQDLTPVLIWDMIGLAVLVSVGIGLVFGLQPAWKAANIDPIDALSS